MPCTLLLSPLRELLVGYKLILASSSPQRKQLMEQVGFDFTVQPSPFNEEMVSKTICELPADYLKIVSKGKALEVAKQHINSKEPVIVIGADTIIVHDDQIIGKPILPRIAKETLRKLSGHLHWVHTGVCLMVVGGKYSDGGPAKSLIREVYFESRTLVKMCNLCDEMIESYVATGEPLNKAGAYGIQGIGAVLIQYVKGEYANVVGLPLNDLTRHLVDLLKVLKTDEIDD